MLLRTTSYARAGLLGNPSDGYYGKTISFTFREFAATITMWESPEIQFVPSLVDDAVFHDVDQLLDEISLYGYYGGIRLLKATAKVFIQYCRENDLALPGRNFSVRYESTIPRLVGLAGSSAICTAMFKSLMAFYEVEIPWELVPTLCLRAETHELNLQAGLQDRVAQAYDGLMYMDFDEDQVKRAGYGRYERLSVDGLPRLYVAYDPTRAEVSGRYHRSLRVLFEQHDQKVVDAMEHFAGFAREGREALLQGQTDDLARLIDANFDLRDEIFSVSEENRRMVHVARAAGASAKFAGSGGGIVGTFADDGVYARLQEGLGAIGCRVLQPTLTEGTHDAAPRS